MKLPLRLLVPPLAWLMRGYYRLVLSTSRVVVFGENRVRPLREAREPRVYSVWHSCIFFGPALGGSEGDQVSALVSPRGQGHLFTTLIRSLGHGTVRGSSTRRGSRGYRRMRAILSRGRAIALSPDGPRGPAFVLKSGIVRLAMHSGAWLIPAHMEATRQWIRRSWDEQRIPLPFTVIVIRFGEPLRIAEDKWQRDEEGLRLQVEEVLNENRRRCMAMAERLRGR